MFDLSKLFRPQSVAVVGGGAWGRNVVENLRGINFAGEIWPVHPKAQEVGGIPAFASIDDLPGTPDAAYVVVNRYRTIDATRALSNRGCGGVVCLASGFLEAQAEDAEGADLQRQLLEAAGDMPLVGPNCYGFINYLDGAALWPDQHGGERLESGVAIICQSSNIAMNMTMQRRGLPLAYLVAAGNQAQTGLSTIGQALLDDPRVTALGLHIEGIDDIRAFEDLAAKARALGKPIVALKVGQSEQARAATVSHTASLAGSDAGSQALLSRLGIARVQSLPVFLETLKLLHVCGPLSSNRVGSMSCSGGEASLMADTALGLGIEFPPLEDPQKGALRDALGPMVALSNPLDYHTYIWRDPDKIGETFSAMMSGTYGIGVVVLDYPREDRCRVDEWYDVTTGSLRAIRESGRPMAIVATIHECMPEHEAQKLAALGIAPMVGVDECLHAIEAAAWLGQARGETTPVLLPGENRDANLVGEAEAKAELLTYGVWVPRGAVAQTPERAGEIAQEFAGMVVLKGLGHAHKTEAGAVKVGLDPGEVAGWATQMGGTGFLVEEMVTQATVELLVGVVRDPAHGFVLTLGAGGQLTEILEDSQSMLIPVTASDVETCLSNLRCAKLIDGYRGALPADRDAIVAAVLAIQDYVVDNADTIEEIEVNPLIATPIGAFAVDALLRRA